jgi:SAM-dependent methyltransferase
MSEPVRRHYEEYPYPHFSLLASLRRTDTYALNLAALWGRFNGRLLLSEQQKILIAGCGSFSPYPFALSNPNCRITALDLSRRNLRRARLHCLLHGLGNVSFRCGNLLEVLQPDEYYGMIDAFGVLHHLDRPEEGLRILAQHLYEGGILRIMVYSRYARRDEEAVRHAFRLLRISDAASARQLLKRALPGSRLHRFVEVADEIAHDSGLADALLHPRVTTFRIGELIELVRFSGLAPLAFAHSDALGSIDEELRRLELMEGRRASPGNFVLYLGKHPNGPCCHDGQIMLNHCLVRAVSPFHIGTVTIPSRLGLVNSPLGSGDRRFLRRFVNPQPLSSLSQAEKERVDGYLRQMFLCRFRT